ncbi:putative tubulin polyglutamylase TTLL9 [Frankliniella fusca]|uniref:Tubulin--tyrosine ligase-like protein 9 n=1 Tax=Frankliniella fusca TaxID=407009 RepID=A0AAE1HHZ6_9NEOP|nr:putative tubulin polyglutamylase TTLL9 [Frankliniella fusca]
MRSGTIREQTMRLHSADSSMAGSGPHHQQERERAPERSRRQNNAEHRKKVRFRCDFCPTMKDVLRDRGWEEVEGDDELWNLFWCEVSQLRATLDHRRLDSNQRVPHFRNHYELTRKNLLSRNLKRLRRNLMRQGRVQEAEMCDCIPVTFELPSEHLMFVEEFRRKHGATWIIKPSSGSQGRGIFIFQKRNEPLLMAHLLVAGRGCAPRLTSSRHLYREEQQAAEHHCQLPAHETLKLLFNSFLDCKRNITFNSDTNRLKELNDWKLAREAAIQNASKPGSRGAASSAAALGVGRVGSATGAAGAGSLGGGAGGGQQPPDSAATTLDLEVMPEVWVVQKYIDRPYLIAGKKFDIRFYVLVTSRNTLLRLATGLENNSLLRRFQFRPLKVWMAREGFARMCGDTYDLRSLNNQRGHLTNMAIQLKGGDNDTPGCKWGLRRLRQFLTTEHGPAAVDRLFQRVAHVVMTSLRSVQQAILQVNVLLVHVPQHTDWILQLDHLILQDRHCFELYGYDVLLDEDLNPWLLEVNASPSLTATDPEDYRLKYQLLEDVLNVIDMEGKLSGHERQVGGLDLLWDDGPVFRRCPEGSCGVLRPQPVNQCRSLNVMLGCFNNRVEQLQELDRWREILAQHSV